MVTSPSKRYEDGVLAERAIATDAPGDPEEIEAKATKPYKAPTPTPRNPEDREALRDARNQRDVEAEEKAVQEAENKAVASAETKPRKRAAKK